MLINFNDIVKNYGRPRGIIHIGAHLLEEREVYLQNGLTNTIWIEANLKIIKRSLGQINLLPTESLYGYAITDISNQTTKLFCTNNGQSSSILKLNKHLEYYPNITVTESIDVMTKRIDDIFLEYNLNINKYNFVNVDIQGAELRALKSFGSLLSKIDYVYSEVNREYLYEKCDLITDIDEYLGAFGFNRVETSWTTCNWGDALYINERIKNLKYDI